MSKTREKLIDAAITYLNTEGKEKISVKKLIQIAGVGYGTFYNHFDSVEAIQWLFKFSKKPLSPIWKTTF